MASVKWPTASWIAFCGLKKNNGIGQWWLWKRESAKNLLFHRRSPGAPVRCRHISLELAYLSSNGEEIRNISLRNPPLNRTFQLFCRGNVSKRFLIVKNMVNRKHFRPKISFCRDILRHGSNHWKLRYHLPSASREGVEYSYHSADGLPWTAVLYQRNAKVRKEGMGFCKCKS